MMLIVPQLCEAYETDQFSNRQQPIADSVNLLNEQVNQSIGKAVKNPGPGMIDGAELAMHGSGRANHVGAKSLADGLKAEANAEHRNLAGSGGHQIEADAGLVRIARSRR